MVLKHTEVIEWFQKLKGGPILLDAQSIKVTRPFCELYMIGEILRIVYF